MQCTVSGTPTTSGKVTATVTTSASNEQKKDNNTSSTSITVLEPADVVANATGLPSSAQVSVNYTGTFSCANTSTVTANAVTCGVSGLPAGVTLSSCTNGGKAWVNGSALAAKGAANAKDTVQCTVSGTPTTAGKVTATVKTSASNELKKDNDTSSTSITVRAPSDVIAIAALPATALVGGKYSGSFSCKNNSAVTALVVTCGISGLPDGVTASCGSWLNGSSLVANQSVECTVSGQPTTAGSVIATVTTSASNEVNTTNDTSIESITVNSPSDMVAGAILPATALVGGNYSGSFSCRNNSAVTALVVTCGVSGLPDGITASCGSWVNGSSLAANQALQCTVSGTPMSAGSFNPTVTTSASNEVNITNNVSINNIIISTPSDVIASSSLPVTAIVSTDYTGSFSCTNGSAVLATGVSCSISGLPDGVTESCGSWVNGSSLAANQAVQCTVSGQPTTAGKVTVRVMASASNEVNTSNNISTTDILSQLLIQATLRGVPINDSTVVCCGSPVVLSVSGALHATYAVTSHTGDVSCELETVGTLGYLKMTNGDGTCTIVGTINGVTTAPLTLQGKNH